MTIDAKSIEEMAEILQNAANTLKEMKENGIKLVEGCGISDDYAEFETTDPVIAEKFDLEENFWGEEEECDPDDDDFDDDEK